jgi:hypothetical protein
MIVRPRHEMKIFLPEGNSHGEQHIGGINTRKMTALLKKRDVEIITRRLGT